ncbi:CD2 antigen cytoplasmic tail-binding protein 2 [Platysternon megacephalum]|uniref:CD2 antigen cytoplasmic tail-binding protein 2 n=1 Tax=Platysternon megacephalum TaxID=55544 RepID=A0A4D9DKN8_9SAUR|nr:CD2 antigen cytoplasmic tail-binding protein 2 [Platysternon megacephalum]
MPKRKVTFEDQAEGDEEEEELAMPKKKLAEPGLGASGPGSRFKGKHSLDSDEEDEDEEGDGGRASKYDILASEDVEGVGDPGLFQGRRLLPQGRQFARPILQLEAGGF